MVMTLSGNDDETSCSIKSYTTIGLLTCHSASLSISFLVFHPGVVEADGVLLLTRSKIEVRCAMASAISEGIPTSPGDSEELRVYL